MAYSLHPLPADHVFVGHLVKLVDAARASVRQHHGAGLKHKLAAHGVAADKGREGEGEGRGVSGGVHRTSNQAHEPACPYPTPLPLRPQAAHRTTDTVSPADVLVLPHTYSPRGAAAAAA